MTMCGAEGLPIETDNERKWIPEGVVGNNAFFFIRE
jgi:hypothetical protein